MSFKKHMQKVYKLLEHTGEETLTYEDTITYIKSKHPNLKFYDWNYKMYGKGIRFYYKKANGHDWYITLSMKDVFIFTYDTSLTHGSAELRSITKENIDTIINHASFYLEKQDKKAKKVLKKKSLSDIGRVGQIKKILKEYHPNLTFEVTRYKAYRFSNINKGFIYEISNTRVADRKLRDNDELMKPIYEWLVTMANVKPMPKVGLIKSSVGVL